MNKSLLPAAVAARPLEFATHSTHERVHTKADAGCDEGEQDPRSAERHGSSQESAMNDAEQSRCLAEHAREVRDHHREALETIRQEREQLRETAEAARAASEGARVRTEAARQVGVDEVRAAAVSLSATLEQMKVVEEMRRTLRDVKDADKLESN